MQKNLDLHGSIETLAETAEIELPSEIEDSEEEDEHEHRRSELYSFRDLMID